MPPWQGVANMIQQVPFEKSTYAAHRHALRLAPPPLVQGSAWARLENRAKQGSLCFSNNAVTQDEICA